MSDDDRRSDDEYWDDVYYFENYLEEEENSGCSYPRIKGSFWIWLVVFIVACNISKGLGEAVLVIGFVWWIISKLIK